MADRALRGMRMGSNSLESEEGVAFVSRQNVDFACPMGHEFTVPFSTEAETPETWECPVCSEVAQAINVKPTESVEDENVKPQRTHWDMLLERRSIEELEVLLDERLQLLRSGRIRRF